MSFTGPANEAAFDWWVGLVHDDHAALYDPYGGSQTGVPGDPFISGKAAMGSNGTFAIGQLNAAGTIDYDIVPPLLGTTASAHTPLSTNGYVIVGRTASTRTRRGRSSRPSSPRTSSPRPGASPATRSRLGGPRRRRSSTPRTRPRTRRRSSRRWRSARSSGRTRPGARDAYDRTIDLFTKMNTGALPIPDALAQIEAAANDALAADRAP